MADTGTLADRRYSKFAALGALLGIVSVGALFAAAAGYRAGQGEFPFVPAELQWDYKFALGTIIQYAAYAGIDSALKDVKENPTLEVPKHLQNAVYDGEKKMGKGKGYKYAHNYDGGFVKQDYLPVEKKYYIPKDIGFEKKIKVRMDELLKHLEKS